MNDSHVLSHIEILSGGAGFYTAVICKVTDPELGEYLDIYEKPCYARYPTKEAVIPEAKDIAEIWELPLHNDT